RGGATRLAAGVRADDQGQGRATDPAVWVRRRNRSYSRVNLSVNAWRARVVPGCAGRGFGQSARSGRAPSPMAICLLLRIAFAQAPLQFARVTAQRIR